MDYTDISIEQVLQRNIPGAISYRNQLVLLSQIDYATLFSQPLKLNATTIFICVDGEIECDINFTRRKVAGNSISICFSGDFIHVLKATDVKGYAFLISPEYYDRLQVFIQKSPDHYINFKANPIFNVPKHEIDDLMPYYSLLKKNMLECRTDALRGLIVAITHTIISIIQNLHAEQSEERVDDISGERSRQIFEKFIRLLSQHHTRERGISFYADKLCLTPNYISGLIKSYSGKSVHEWISEFVILEANILLRYSEKNIQEIAYALNFTTQSAFGKYYKKQTGITPKQYRQPAVGNEE